MREFLSKLILPKSEQEIRDFLASSEMCYDPMYQASMDSAWHYWLQPKYDQVQRKNWIDKNRNSN